MLAALLISGCGASESKPKSSGAAGLVFTRESGQVSGVWVADADGSNPRQIVANGSGGTLSPDGRRMTYVIPAGAEHTTTNVKNVVEGDPRSLGEVTVLTWSLDSHWLAVRDQKGLLLVDAESGAARKLASGDVRKASFSPDGTAIAFSRGNGKKALDWRSDIFTIRLSDDSVSRLTRDGHSDEPAWGANWIAFRRFNFKGDRAIGAIYVMHSDGTAAKQLAPGELGPNGLEALELSKDGVKLLACAPAQGYCEPVMFSTSSGEWHDVRVNVKAVTLDLSDDGNQVLAATGTPGGPHGLYAIPFAGGSPRLLVQNVSSARWAG